jgi:hypothetical protein
MQVVERGELSLDSFHLAEIGIVTDADDQGVQLRTSRGLGFIELQCHGRISPFATYAKERVTPSAA